MQPALSRASNSLNLPLPRLGRNKQRPASNSVGPAPSNRVRPGGRYWRVWSTTPPSHCPVKKHRRAHGHTIGRGQKGGRQRGRKRGAGRSEALGGCLVNLCMAM
eukprot:CAMPEP_0174282884 /NCGR_PEP_ID=MMETSP0809-20121228/3470_1 /TAXON_ID=73025 ORGANISM="Eutreptiella gymnastica-like, Strain CCMP1594" /NCGR_SAMPLE_ID=MMETSP0809 /ASSEMBLY_ACC=CAM_ASM_000658 /LENGTH=103 /DNA_ID=CAMNT_0015377399 /DNA_START=261 /DNA_END=572 /DNA_ORIENTATION=-